MSEKAVFSDLKSKIVLIDENGNKFEDISRDEAFSKSEDVGLDLVKVGETEDHSICKIMDFNKNSYKKQRAS